MKYVRIRELGPSGPARTIYPDTDHDATVASLEKEGYVRTFDGLWDTDLERDPFKVTVTTVPVH